MRQIFIFVVLIALIVGGVWWFVFREKPGVTDPVPMQTEESVLPAREEPRGDVPQEEVVEETEERGIETPSAEDASTAPSEGEQRIVGAFQWAGEFRIIFSHIGKLRAIEQGRYFLKEGEEAPDLHREYAALHGSFGKLAFPEGDEELRALMVELDGALGDIITPLSQPPTPVELDAAYAERDALSPKIDALYMLLSERRR